MLSEQQIEIIAEALIPLFNYLEREVILDTAERISETMAYTRTAELKAISMKALGYSPAKIRKECTPACSTASICGWFRIPLSLYFASVSGPHMETAITHATVEKTARHRNVSFIDYPPAQIQYRSLCPVHSVSSVRCDESLRFPHRAQVPVQHRSCSGHGICPPYKKPW